MPPPLDIQLPRPLLPDRKLSRPLSTDNQLSRPPPPGCQVQQSHYSLYCRYTLLRLTVSPAGNRLNFRFRPQLLINNCPDLTSVASTSTSFLILQSFRTMHEPFEALETLETFHSGSHPDLCEIILFNCFLFPLKVFASLCSFHCTVKNVEWHRSRFCLVLHGDGQNIASLSYDPRNHHNASVKYVSVLFIYAKLLYRIATLL